MSDGARIAEGNYAPPYLSPAEEEVLPLLLAGKREWEIAQALEKSAPTVNKQVGRIYQAFGVHSKHELLVKWLATERQENLAQNGANGVNTPLLSAHEPPIIGPPRGRSPAATAKSSPLTLRAGMRPKPFDSRR